LFEKVKIDLIVNILYNYNIMSITNLVSLNDYILMKRNDLTFIQVTKKGIIPIYNIISIIVNVINTNIYTYDSLDISNEEIFNNYSRSNTPLLLFYYTYNSYVSFGYININTTITPPQISNFINSIMSITNLATLNTYISNTSINLTFIQVTKNGVTPIYNINSVITSAINTSTYTYQYLDISNEEIFNNYTISDKPILLLYYNYNSYVSFGYINIYTTTTPFDISNFIFSKTIKPTTINDLNIYLLNDPNTLTFIQVKKNGISLIDNLSNIITATNYSHNYIDVSSTEIFNSFSTNGKPILLIYLKYKSTSTVGYINVFNTTTTNDIKNLIHSRLEKPVTTTQLELYLKYTKYTTTFIRILEFTPTIKTQYIMDLLADYNKTIQSNYEYFELSDQEIVKYYRLKVNILPVILLFKKSLFNLITPCKYLTSEDYYTDQTILQLQKFLKIGLR
jgi:hypothetical protein